MAATDRKAKAVTDVGARVDGPIFTEEMSGPTDAIAQAHKPVMHKRRRTGMYVHLRFVNRSEDGYRTEVVLFQKNAAAGMDELAIAWRVIRYCGPLEANYLAQKLFERMNWHLAKKGQRPRASLIMGATIIVAPSSTKNTNECAEKI
jgi:hypothetical protein